jgi:O-antigen/teichoic acid export membrane protein
MSLAGVIFPLFSQLKGAENYPYSGLYYKSLKYVLLIMFPFCFICTVFAKEILHTWLGHEYAVNSFHIMQIMAVAVMRNGMATIPFSLIQAAGRPDITAKLHVIEVLIYVPMLLLLIKKWCLLGAALAWLIRVVLDLLLLIYFSNRSILKRSAQNLNTDKFTAERTLVLLLVLIISPAFIKDFAIRIFASILALIAFVTISWKGLLGAKEKEFVADKLRWRSD